MPDFDRLSLHIEATLGNLYLHDSTVHFNESASDVADLLESTPSLPGVIITDGDRLIGMVSRKQFYEQISRPFHIELFARKPIDRFYRYVQVDFLVLPVSLPVDEAAQRALMRPSHLLYEPIVVDCGQGQYKLLEMPELLTAHVQIHTLVEQELQWSQQELAQEKELAQITLHSIGDAVITTDATGRVRSLNPVAEKLTGWSLEDARTRRVAEVFRIIHEYTREPVTNPVDLTLREGCGMGLDEPTVLLSRSGQEYGIQDSAAPIRDRSGKLIGAVLVFRDATQERALARQLTWQATHDPLTQLLNRQEFEHRVEQAWQVTRQTQQILMNSTAEQLEPAQGMTHVLCCLDLDRFKIVNDTCGHAAGDELLRQVSDLLQNWVRSSDSLARLGGDEFGVLLYDCPLEKGLEIAQNIRQSVQDFRFVCEGNTFVIGSSIGVTLIDRQTSSTATAMVQADTAGYWAKRQGRNRVKVYSPEKDSQPTRSVSWITQITRALEENSFQLYGQAIAPISSEARMPHYEILLRIRDDQQQIISPREFLPTAERYNLMPEIDRWVIRKLFSTLAATHQRDQHWYCLDAQQDCRYTINLSGASINEGKLVQYVEHQLSEYAIPPELICFEITETVAITNLGKAAKVIRALKDMGCQFALDDFGCGMSSFGYLKTLPVDYLKIDGSFVQEIIHDEVAREMVTAINRIGQVMNLQTVAECVESSAILEEVRSIGLNYAQGFGIAHPFPLVQ
jgi:diguanylate cyclase (GGDEF)-like protein/PAS domain S-box-containing protein